MRFSRLLAIAKRCQLLTGSYEGKTHDCPCYKDCPLTEEDRRQLRDHPDVIKQTELNWEEYRKLKEEQ